MGFERKGLESYLSVNFVGMGFELEAFAEQGRACSSGFSLLQNGRRYKYKHHDGGGSDVQTPTPMPERSSMLSMLLLRAARHLAIHLWHLHGWVEHHRLDLGDAWHRGGEFVLCPKSHPQSLSPKPESQL